jgi:hypothetical protein
VCETISGHVFFLWEEGWEWKHHCLSDPSGISQQITDLCIPQRSAFLVNTSWFLASSALVHSILPTKIFTLQSSCKRICKQYCFYADSFVDAKIPVCIYSCPCSRGFLVIVSSSPLHHFYWLRARLAFTVQTYVDCQHQGMDTGKNLLTKTLVCFPIKVNLPGNITLFWLFYNYLFWMLYNYVSP